MAGLVKSVDKVSGVKLHAIGVKDGAVMRYNLIGAVGEVAAPVIKKTLCA
jgi:hypothetical protein